MPKYIVNEFDTDGNNSVYGPYYTKDKAIEKFEEVKSTIVLEDCAEWVDDKEDIFSWGVDNYTYYLTITEAQ